MLAVRFVALGRHPGERAEDLRDLRASPLERDVSGVRARDMLGML